MEGAVRRHRKMIKGGCEKLGNKRTIRNSQARRLSQGGGGITKDVGGGPGT